MAAELYITDGVTAVNLLQANTGNQGIGVSVAHLQRPVRDTGTIFTQKYPPITEMYTIHIAGKTQDSLIATLRALDGLLVKADNAHNTEAELGLVWLVSRGASESNTRYAVIYTGSIAEYGNIYDQPFASQNPVLAEIDLGITRGVWMANPPNSPICKPLTNTVAWRNYYPAYINRSAIATNLTGLYRVSINGYMFAGVSGAAWASATNGSGWASVKAFSAGNIPQKFIVAFGKVYTAVARAAGANADSGIWSCSLIGGAWVQELSAVNCYSFAIYQNGTLLSGAEGSIYAKPDSAAAWSVYTSAMLGPVRALVVTPRSTIVAGDGYSLWRQPVSGGAFSLVPAASVGPFWDMILVGNRILAVGTYPLLYTNSREIDASIDDGLSFTSTGRLGFMKALYYSPTKQMTFFHSSVGFYYSTDAGQSWTDGGGSLIQVLNTSGIAENNFGSLFLGDDGDITEVPWTTVRSGPVEPTDCYTPVYVGNRSTEPMLAYLAINDISVSITYIAPELSPTGVALLPTVPAVNDSFLIGFLPTNVTAGYSRPNALVFTITQGNRDIGLTWQYSTGPGWSNLPDFLDTTGNLSRTGVISWSLPSGWVTKNVTTTSGTISALWIQAIVTSVGPINTPPKASSIYPPARNYVEVTGVSGDIPALARLLVTNVSDNDTAVARTVTNSMMVGLRSVDRGPTFVPFLSPRDLGGVHTGGTLTPFTSDFSRWSSGIYFDIVPAVTWGSYVGYTPNLPGPHGLTSLDSTPQPRLSDFIGTYRAFLRYTFFGTDAVHNIRLSLNYLNGVQVISQGETKTLRTVTSTLGQARILDMGQFTFGVTDYLRATEVGTPIYFNLEATTTNIAGGTIHVGELILMPVDEWVGYFEDMGKTSIANAGGLTVGQTLDIDSASYHKRQLRSLVKSRGSDVAYASWKASASGPLTLNPGKSQRLYFLTEYWNGEYLACPYDMVHRVELQCQERYLGLRGNG